MFLLKNATIDTSLDTPFFKLYGNERTLFIFAGSFGGKNVTVRLSVNEVQNAVLVDDTNTAISAITANSIFYLPPLGEGLKIIATIAGPGPSATNMNIFLADTR